MKKSRIMSETAAACAKVRAMKKGEKRDAGRAAYLRYVARLCSRL